MRFKLPYNRTLASTCGISIEFQAGVYHNVPPAMYQQVRDAGGVPESDDVDAAPLGAVPDTVEARRNAMFPVFKVVVARNVREDFTAGNMPSPAAMARELGWTPPQKELLSAWNMYVAMSNQPPAVQPPAPAPVAAEPPAPAPVEAPRAARKAARR